MRIIWRLGFEIDRWSLVLLFFKRHQVIKKLKKSFEFLKVQGAENLRVFFPRGCQLLLKKNFKNRQKYKIFYIFQKL
jgi:hypothetical protein